MDDAKFVAGDTPMTMRLVSFYEGNTPWIDAAHHSGDGMLRSIRHRQMPPLVADMNGYVGLTVQAGTGFYTKRKLGVHSHADTATVGRAFLDGPGERCHLNVSGESRVVQLKLDAAVFERILLEDHDAGGGISDIRPLQGGVDIALLSLLGRALLAKDEVREVAIRMVVARLFEAHAGRQVRFRRRGLSPAGLRRVRDLVVSDPIGVTLAAMAAEAGLSIYHFSREFRYETGLSPWAFVTQHRIWHASHQLGEPMRTLNEIALRSGFTHASHMGRAFRRLLGITPAAARGRLLP
jgi:AraC family transcriptional regulator